MKTPREHLVDRGGPRDRRRSTRLDAESLKTTSTGPESALTDQSAKNENQAGEFTNIVNINKTRGFICRISYAHVGRSLTVDTHAEDEINNADVL